MTKSRPEAWCDRCGTQHERQDPCPGELLATEPERYGWRVHVQSASGDRNLGLLLARCGELWRSRIVTLPDNVWTIPGGASSMKFAGTTATMAESKARQFIREVCQDQRWTMTRAIVEDEPAAVPPEGCGMDAGPATRTSHRVQVRFGRSAPESEGATHDLSGTGLFLAADQLMATGQRLKMVLDLEPSLPLDGTVIWVRERQDGGRPRGMGIEIDRPPEGYRRRAERLRRRFLARQQTA